MDTADDRTLRARLEALERELVAEALRTTQGDVRAAAGILGASERTLWRRLADPLALDPADYRPPA